MFVFLASLLHHFLVVHMLTKRDETRKKKIASLPVTAGIITGLCTEFKVAAVATTQKIQQSLANRGFANSTFQVFAVYHLYPVLTKKKGHLLLCISVCSLCKHRPGQLTCASRLAHFCLDRTGACNDIRNPFSIFHLRTSLEDIYVLVL